MKIFEQDSVVAHLRVEMRGRHGFWIAANDNKNEGHWEWLHRG